jgi:hypothetical protein
MNTLEAYGLLTKIPGIMPLVSNKLPFNFYPARKENALELREAEYQPR